MTRPDWPAFFKTLEAYGDVSRACVAAGVGRSWVYCLRSRRSFRERMDAARAAYRARESGARLAHAQSLALWTPLRARVRRAG